MTDFKFDKEKAITSMLYICHSLGGNWDKYSLLKILYFAEQKHLAIYGRPITGDNMIAMPYGPVPSISYDEVKYSKANPEYFDIQDNVVIAIAAPNLDCLSESDIECLNESIEENKDLGFSMLRNKSHDSAYEWTINNIGQNSTIPYTKIAEAAGAENGMLDYMKSISENQACQLNAAN